MQAMLEESDELYKIQPHARQTSGSRSPRAPRETLPTFSDDPQARQGILRDEVLSPGTSIYAHDGAARGMQMSAIEAERAKSMLLEAKVAAYEQRLKDLENSIHHGDLLSSSRSCRHSPGHQET
jgi:hypothetical protein